MTKQEAKDYVKRTPPPKGYFTEAKTQYEGQPTYVCPACGNGSGKTGTGFHQDPNSPGYYKCFKCGEYGDIIHFIGLNEGLDPGSGEAFNKAYEVYNITLGQTGNHTARNSPGTLKETKPVQEPVKKKEPSLNAKYYYECTQRLDEAMPYLEARGISKATARKYKLGYDPKQYFIGDKADTPALIIPTSGESYEARSLDPKANQRWNAQGKRRPFNLDILDHLKESEEVAIVEGAIDALSILELGYPAIGLGGAESTFLEYLEGVQEKPHLLIAMDNDEAGRGKANKLSSKLSEKGISHTIINLSGDENDPNDLLRANRQELEERLKLGRISPERKKDYLNSSAKYSIKDLLKTINAGTYNPICNTGYDLLDEELGDGLFMGLYILGAGSSVGKTTYLLQMVDQIAKSGQDVIVFSLEMGKHELMAKSVSRITAQLCLERNLNLRYAKSSNGILNQDRYITYDPIESKLIEDAFLAYGEYAGNLYIHEGQGNITAQTIRETVENHILFTGNKPVILIDYLQLIPPHNDRWSDKQNMDYAVSSLRRTARDFNIPVIVVSSYNRASYSTEANLGAFKESGAIEYSADVALALQFTKKVDTGKKAPTGNDLAKHERTEKRKDLRSLELVILKNRNGKTGGKLYYQYHPALNLFIETHEPEQEERI